MNRAPLALRTAVAATGIALCGGLAAPAAFASTATPGSTPDRGAHSTGAGSGAVFVANDRLAGNQIVAYRRAADGTLQRAGVYRTGGLGGRLNGAVVDFTASGGSVVADRADHRLLAVNAGSNTVSVFAVDGNGLQLRQVVASGGTFPVSVAVNGNRVFILNARDGGSVQGYRMDRGQLRLVPAWHRDLGLPQTTGAAEFTHTPGQVAFTPDGRQLIVTTKAATNSILVYAIASDGTPAATPVVHTEAGTVPFGVDFDATGTLQVAVAGTNTVESYTVGADGTLTLLGTTPTGQAATCWITASGNLLAASNTGSGTITTLLAQPGAAPTKLADTATGAGTVDAAFTPSGERLYVQSGGTGTVDAYRVAKDGTLTQVQTVAVPDAVGGEGIVAW